MFPTFSTRTLFCLIFTGLLLSGCSRANRPDGLPKLHSCTITITQDGKPLPEAMVEFSGGVSDQWPVSGLTDSSGTARMVTYGQFPGAPAGDYKVTVKKTVEEVLSAGGAEGGRSADVYSLVEVRYTQPEETPLEIHVDKGGARETFDVGKEGRALVDSIRPGT